MPSNEDRRYQINIDQGDDETLIFRYKDSNGDVVNLTGSSASFIIDWGVAKNQITGAQIAASGSLTLSSPSNGITIDGAAGQITVTITDAQTSLLPSSGVWEAVQNASYQLRVTFPGDAKETLIAGPLRIFRNRF